MSKDMLLYIAIKNREERSNMEDSLVLDGIDVTAFPSAAKLWEAFQIKPAQFVITDRRFAHDFDGLKLARAIRKHFMLPYAFIVVRSATSTLDGIKQGMAAGVDDYIIKPHNRFQIRSRVLVGKRWLEYINSMNKNEGRTAAPRRGEASHAAAADAAGAPSREGGNRTAWRAQPLRIGTGAAARAGAAESAGAYIQRAATAKPSPRNRHADAHH
jgi:DNA-binding NtrC family response regulator